MKIQRNIVIFLYVTGRFRTSSEFTNRQHKFLFLALATCPQNSLFECSELREFLEYNKRKK